MSDIRERAKVVAENEFSKYANKDSEFLAVKYIEYQNKKTVLIDKLNRKQDLSDDDLYMYYLCDEMERRLSFILANFMLYGLGYEKDKKDMWGKKKKGLFR